MTTLYIKIHNKTGLKYFGQTIRTGKSLESYWGSGIYWRKHLDKHGYDISTEIYAQTEILTQEFKELALKFSQENDIVNSKEWANLMEENCESGIAHGFTHTEETRNKMSESKVGIPCPKTPALIARMKKERVGKGNPMYGKKHSEETLKKMSENAVRYIHTEEERKHLSKKHLDMKPVKCPYCSKEGKKAVMVRWHFDNCKFK